MNDFLTQKSGSWRRMRNWIRSRDIIGGTCCSLDVIMNIFDVFIQIWKNKQKTIFKIILVIFSGDFLKRLLCTHCFYKTIDDCTKDKKIFAVHEWLQSKHAFHVMRDHPGHDLPMLAGMWGLKLTGRSSSSSDDNNLRPILRRIFLAILRHTSAYWEYWDPQTDQMILRRFFWPWAKTIMLQHDSFHCDLFAKSRSWPSQRPEGQLDNFVGSPVSLNATLTDECPLRCRPREHPEWKQC